jgi:hypothetical protein
MSVCTWFHGQLFDTLPTDAIGLVFAARGMHQLLGRLNIPLFKNVLFES